MYRDDEGIRKLAERLRQARRARHLTQEQVADLTSVSQSAISLYELGRREPYIGTAKRLAVAYEVTLDWLMGITDVGGPTYESIPIADLVSEEATEPTSGGLEPTIEVLESEDAEPGPIGEDAAAPESDP